MIFNSVEYAFFLPAALLLYWSLAHRAQNALLVAASYLFYGWWDWRFLGLLALSTAIDFSVGLRLGSETEERRRRRLLLVSVAGNLGILGVFKYYDFFVSSTRDLIETIGLDANPALLEVLLPVGISFYTFQSLSYSFDVYRRRIEPERDPITFAVYVAFFPQLVAGPIERARHLLPQFRSSRPMIKPDTAVSALSLIVFGLFKKVVIADTMAPIVDQSFGSADSAGWLTLSVGAVAFGLQIYGDFAGYTAIARGSARLFGIELMQNFAQPYLSRNITEFWRRWHISLSQWLRDYLYVPLGGNRRGTLATYRNLMLTMVLGGLWHGAAWTFVAWGSIHGLMLAGHRRFSSLRDRDLASWRIGHLSATLMTFVAVHFAWVFFRAASFGDAVEYLTGIATLRAGPVDHGDLTMVVAALVLTLSLDLVARRGLAHTVATRRPALAGVGAGIMIALLIASTGREFVPFIYFQF